MTVIIGRAGRVNIKPSGVMQMSEEIKKLRSNRKKEMRRRERNGRDNKHGHSEP